MDKLVLATQGLGFNCNRPGLPCEVGPAFADIGLPCNNTATAPVAPAYLVAAVAWSAYPPVQPTKEVLSVGPYCTSKVDR